MDSQRVRAEGVPPAGGGEPSAIHTVAGRVPSALEHDGLNDDTFFGIPPNLNRFDQARNGISNTGNFDEIIPISLPPFNGRESAGRLNVLSSNRNYTANPLCMSPWILWQKKETFSLWALIILEGICQQFLALLAIIVEHGFLIRALCVKHC